MNHRAYSLFKKKLTFKGAQIEQRLPTVESRGI